MGAPYIYVISSLRVNTSKFISEITGVLRQQKYKYVFVHKMPSLILVSLNDINLKTSRK